MNRRRAFTLVELLVVIGIIALLISILLPVLNRVRWQAKLVSCGARMRDIVLAVQMYAGDNKGALPPAAFDRGAATFNLNWGGGSLMDAYRENYLTGTTWPSGDDGSNLGRLWRAGYLKTSKTFYCPATNGTPASDPPANQDLRNYTLNPHYKFADSGMHYLQFWWKKLPGYGHVSCGTWLNAQTGTVTAVAVPVFRRAILAEPLYSTSVNDIANLTHAIGNRRAYNFAYPDGSVLSYTDSKFVARQVDNWVRLVDLSNALQSAIDGNNPGFSDYTWAGKIYAAIPVQPQ